MILSILDIKNQGRVYVAVSLACILFAMIYEFFSHDVYSYFMIFSFIIPLFMGIIAPFIIYYVFRVKKLPEKIENNLYNSAIAAFTIGSIMEGVVQIYGTTNSKIYIYLIVGVALLLLSLILYLKRKN